MEDQRLEDLTNPELVAIYNDLAEPTGQPTLASWKRAKATLIKRIEGLRAEVLAAEEYATTKEHAAEAAASCNLDEHVATTQSTAEELAKSDGTKRTIKSVSINLLCHVTHYENRDEKSGPENHVEKSHPKARSVGLSYDDVLEQIHAQFPGCETSVACLRWYAVKIRANEQGYEDLTMCQRRPRAKPKTAS